MPQTKVCAPNQIFVESRNQQQLAGRAARLQEAHGIGSLREWESSADRNRQLSFARELKYRIEAAAMDLLHAVYHRHDKAADLLRFREQMPPHIDRIGRAARASIENEMTERSEAREALLEGRLPDRIEDQIDAVPVGDTHRLSREIMGRIVDDLTRAELPHQAHLLIARYRPDHRRTCCDRDLDRRDAHASRRRMH